MANILPIIETERLKLSLYTAADAAFLIELMNTKGWLQYIGDRNMHTQEDAIRYIQDRILQPFHENGYGMYKVSLKEYGIPIGSCGLVQRRYLPYPDIGFAYLTEYCGKGYGYEAAKAILSQLCPYHSISKIGAITTPDNEPSQRLLKKLGFTDEGLLAEPDTQEQLCLFENKIH